MQAAQPNSPIENELAPVKSNLFSADSVLMPLLTATPCMGAFGLMDLAEKPNPMIITYFLMILIPVMLLVSGRGLHEYYLEKKRLKAKS